MGRRLGASAGLMLVLAACGQPMTEEGDPQRVAATGTVIAVEGEPAMLCHAVLESYPPQCGGGVELAGVDPAELPGATTESGVTFTETVRVVGTLVGGVLTAEDVSAARPGEPGEGVADEPAPPPPDDGRPGMDAQGAVAALEAVAAYAAEHDADYAGRWFDAPERPETLVVSFTDNLEDHAAALQELWSHDLEVVGAQHALVELEATLERVNAASENLAGDGVEILTVGVDERANVVSVQIALADEQRVERLRRVADPEQLDVHGWLEPMQ